MMQIETKLFYHTSRLFWVILVVVSFLHIADALFHLLFTSLQLE